MATAAIGLGSNLGDRRGHIETALTKLHASTGLAVTRVSALYQTAPWGELDQPAFLNACALLSVDLTPHALLEQCLLTEMQMGRVRQKRWGPRLIDLDVLTVGDHKVSSETLTLPHPEIQNRTFVLAPLAELMPDFELLGQSIKDHLASADMSGIVRLSCEPAAEF